MQKENNLNYQLRKFFNLLATVREIQNPGQRATKGERRPLGGRYL
jgi:hypothetical protein